MSAADEQRPAMSSTGPNLEDLKRSIETADFEADREAVMAEFWAIFSRASGEWAGIKDWREAARIIRERDSAKGKA